ncbi:MAG: WecB/TagA/CpsF family glycosyltransferase [Chloroflexaceae bacterium]|jgi:N-acetylglucosaminyldiphosphoundecaprenol N-acetyl-beta-D-mannosaminyltransferase|nr:WecB/TagA/CpsF family glycosyltransferase [Chloroflexaceae bacterium]
MGQTIVLMGVPIEDLTMDEAMARCEQYIRHGRAAGSPHYVATANTDFAVISLYDPDLRRLLLEADMTTADGMPLVWGARLLGLPIEGRVTGSDMLPALAELAAKNDFSVFFMGARPGVATRAVEVLRAKNPGLNVAGILSPPNAALLDMDPTIVETIRAAKPDLLVVALGTPKQEKWIKMHLHELGVPLCIGVGASFDFLAGTAKRAPVWMQKAGLEWFFRLVNEPRRLWRRYVLDMFYFSVFFARQWWEMRRKGPNQPLPPLDMGTMDDATILTIQGRMDVQNQQAFIDKAQQALDKHPYLIVDMSGATFLDSSALGTLVNLTNRARKAGGQLWLTGVPAPIYNLFTMLRLENFFELRPDVASAIVERHSLPESLVAQERTASHWGVFSMPRIVDATNAPALYERCSQLMATNPRVILDFSETVFLASAGLAILVKLHRYGQEHNGMVRLANCTRDVARSIQLVKLDTLFTLYTDVEAAAQAQLPPSVAVPASHISLPVAPNRS